MEETPVLRTIPIFSELYVHSTEYESVPESHANLLTEIGDEHCYTTLCCWFADGNWTLHDLSSNRRARNPKSKSDAIQKENTFYFQAKLASLFNASLTILQNQN